MPGGRFLKAVCGLIWALAGSPAGEPTPGTPPIEWKLPIERVPLKSGPGQAAVTGQCAVCHSLDYLTTQPLLSRAAWQSIVEKMRVRYQAPIGTNLVPAVVGYLLLNYGRENPPTQKP